MGPLSFRMNVLVTPLVYGLGLAFLVFGVAGFFTGSPLLIFPVDPLQHVIHLVSGLMGFYCARSGYAMARAYLMFFGLVYAAVSVVGFLQGGTVLGLFAVAVENTVLHAGVAVLSLLVGFGSKRD